MHLFRHADKKFNESRQKDKRGDFYIFRDESRNFSILVKIDNVLYFKDKKKIFFPFINEFFRRYNHHKSII